MTRIIISKAVYDKRLTKYETEYLEQIKREEEEFCGCGNTLTPRDKEIHYGICSECR